MNAPESRLQALLEEEKVIKATLQQIKSKYLQLQVEHMALSRAQKNVLSKCSAKQDSNKTNLGMSTVETVSESVNNIPCSEKSNLYYVDDKILFDELNKLPLNDDGHISDSRFSELPVTVGYSNPCANLDEDFREEDLDNPYVMNKLQLASSQTALTLSEVDSSDESE